MDKETKRSQATVCKIHNGMNRDTSLCQGYCMTVRKRGKEKLEIWDTILGWRRKWAEVSLLSKLNSSPLSETLMLFSGHISVYNGTLDPQPQWAKIRQPSEKKSREGRKIGSGHANDGREPEFLESTKELSKPASKGLFSKSCQRCSHRGKRMLPNLCFSEVRFHSCI